MTDYYIDISEKEDPAFQGGCNLHDPLAAAVALDPTLVTTFPIDLMVETQGPDRGRTVGDPARLLSRPKHTRVALEVDVERFTRRFMHRLLSLASSAK
jgi:purine nucleosidase